MIEVHLEGCIYELNFRYNAKTVVYTNSSSDIPKLGDILGHLYRSKGRTQLKRR
jgi:hypothetical protein